MKVVKYLVGHGTSLHQLDNEGHHALHYAVLAGHLYVSQLVLRAGVCLTAGAKLYDYLLINSL